MKNGSRIHTPRLIQGKGSPFLGGGIEKENRIKVTLVANAGVLVEINGVGLLVDGIHYEKGHPFSPVATDDLRLMLEGTGLFKSLDYLLFTHEHPDHFSPEYVSKFLHKRTVRGIFLPSAEAGSSSLKKLYNQVRQQGVSFWELNFVPGNIKRIPLARGLVVTVIGGRHMGPQFNHLSHYNYLFTLYGKNLLFTGDADHVPEHFEGLHNIAHLDALFVNPIFYHHPDGRKIIKELRPRRIVIYHMPFAEDDTMNFHYMVNSDIKKYCHSQNYPEVFCIPRQSFIL